MEMANEQPNDVPTNLGLGGAVSEAMDQAESSSGLQAADLDTDLDWDDLLKGIALSSNNGLAQHASQPEPEDAPMMDVDSQPQVAILSPYNPDISPPPAIAPVNIQQLPQTPLQSASSAQYETHQQPQTGPQTPLQIASSAQYENGLLNQNFTSATIHMIPQQQVPQEPQQTSTHLAMCYSQPQPAYSTAAQQHSVLAPQPQAPNGFNQHLTLTTANPTALQQSALPAHHPQQAWTTPNQAALQQQPALPAYPQASNRNPQQFQYVTSQPSGNQAVPHSQASNNIADLKRRQQQLIQMLQQPEQGCMPAKQMRYANNSESQRMPRPHTPNDPSNAQTLSHQTSPIPLYGQQSAQSPARQIVAYNPRMPMVNNNGLQYPSNQAVTHNPHAPMAANNYSQNTQTPASQAVAYNLQILKDLSNGLQYAQTLASQKVAYNPRMPMATSNCHQYAQTSASQTVAPQTPMAANNWQQSAEASPPEIPLNISQRSLEQKDAIKNGDLGDMQLRVFYKHLRIRCDGVKADENSRHDIKNPDGFVLFHDFVHPEAPKAATEFHLPLHIGADLDAKDNEMIVDVCKDMKGGLHVYFDQGVLYATRYSVTGVFFWANDKNSLSTETVLLKRKKPTLVFDYNAYTTRLQKMTQEMIGKESNPVVVFTLAFPWVRGSGSLLKTYVHAEVTPLAAFNNLHGLNSSGKTKNKSIPKGSLKKEDAYKSNEPNSLNEQMNK